MTSIDSMGCAASGSGSTTMPFLHGKWPKLFMLAKMKKNSYKNHQSDMKLLIVLAFANLAALLYMLQKTN
jgi:hypothetical protein